MRTQAFGKWILAGEHSVIRGGPALVFPVYAKSLSLVYTANDEPANCEFAGETGNEFKLLFWGVMQKGLELTGKSGLELHGKFEFTSSVPVGAGLGASATLCVTIAKWFLKQSLIEESGVYEFARQLENLFHGESSGVDIAVALSGKALHFERNGERYEFEPQWQPHWYISHTGKRGITSECVTKVKKLWQKDARLGQQLDQEMKAAVEKAEKALSHPSDDAISELTSAIEQAAKCFEKWGLAGGEVQTHMQALVKAGALATKPTGSGDGGYVLSLWSAPPTDFIPQFGLIPLSKNNY